MNEKLNTFSISNGEGEQKNNINNTEPMSIEFGLEDYTRRQKLAEFALSELSIEILE